MTGGRLTYRAISYGSTCVELQVPTIDVVVRTARLKCLQNMVRRKKQLANAKLEPLHRKSTDDC